MSDIAQAPDRPLLFGYGEAKGVKRHFLRQEKRPYNRAKGPSWSEKERDILRSFYVQAGVRACLERLPGKSKGAAMQEARRLGLKTHRRWTSAENMILSEGWGSTPLEKLAQKLDRTERAILKHIWKDLDLGKGIPPGCEGLTAAATRVGFAPQTLRKVLAFSGIKPTRLITKKAGRWKMYHVCKIDVDTAVNLWMATENVASAALRRGLTPGTLRHWLLDAGVEGKPERTHWRVQPDVIDRVIAERHALYRSNREHSGGVDTSWDSGENAFTLAASCGQRAERQALASRSRGR